MTYLWLPGHVRGPLLNAGAFSPAQVSAVRSWLRLAASTPVASEYAAVVDVLNSNPTAQADADRKLAATTSANALPTMTSDGTDVLLWPLVANNNQTTELGIAFWFKPGAVAGSQAMLSARNIAAGAPASANKLMLWLSGNKLACDAYTSGSNGRRIESTTTSMSAGTWYWLRLQYDSAVGGDGCVSLYVDETLQAVSPSNLGAGGALADLPSPTGHWSIGAVNDSDTPSTPVQNNGVFGPNLFILGANLSAAQAAALRLFEQPT